VQSATAALSEAQRLVEARSFAAAVEVLEDVVDREPTLGVLYLLAAACLELGEDDKALRYASAAVESDPSSAPARDVLAKVHLALGDYVAALSDFEAVAVLAREQRQAPPNEFSIPRILPCTTSNSSITFSPAIAMGERPRARSTAGLRAYAAS
jgi:tetratricopeptide (TPR) repeat protein